MTLRDFVTLSSFLISETDALLAAKSAGSPRNPALSSLSGHRSALPATRLLPRAYPRLLSRILHPQVKRALHALVLLDLLRLLERSMRRRHLHLCAVEQLLDGEAWPAGFPKRGKWARIAEL